MNKEKINAGIDRMAEEAKETMNLLSDKIDRATRCGNEKAARIKRSAKAGLRRTTDAVQETVDRTAERIRDKLSEYTGAYETARPHLSGMRPPA